MAKGVSKILQSVGIGLVLLALIAANVLGGLFFEMITIFFGGYGIDYSDLDYEQGDEVCQDIAAEGIVLLKNQDDTLPLTDVTQVNIFGWGATDGGFVMSGAGSGSAEDRGSKNEYRRTFLQGMEEAGFAYNKELIERYESYKDGREQGDYWNQAYPFFNLIEPEADYIRPLIADAQAFSDTAFVVISRLGGEGQDLPREQRKWNDATDGARSYLQLSTEEEDLLELVNENFGTVVVIINACNAMELGFLEDARIDAAISVGGPGQSGSVAISEILRGDITPSGKTVDTYAYDLTTAATYANAPNCRELNAADGGVRSYTNGGNYIDYAEGIYVGYKWYESADTQGFWDTPFAENKWGISNGSEDVVQYPFGYGLSYTDFEWRVQSVSPADGSTIDENTEITVTVWVSNVGAYEGQDTVQLYYEPPYYEGSVEKSSVNLAAFAKTEILETDGDRNAQLLTLTFRAEDMKSYDDYGKNENGFCGYLLENGDYIFTLRTDSHTVSSAANATFTYHIEEDILLETDSATGNPVENRFVGDAVNDDDGISIDGRNTDQNISYMTRMNFTSTFPTVQGRRTKHSRISSLADDWLPTHKETNVMPEQGRTLDDPLFLCEEDGSLNTDLVLELGAEYADADADEAQTALWNDFLDQITRNELVGLVEGGGYRTAAIPSINKPEVTDLDGPSGLNDSNMTAADKEAKGWTSFPVETVMGQTWNARLSYVYGLAVGNEAAKTQVGGWYAPAVNIHRSPFDGRNFEYYSEDAYLSGIMGAETVRGALNNGLYCYVKHFAVNETEYGRSGLYTWLTEQTLREIYLRPFEICVKEGKANAVMSSFNRIGATWAGGSYPLLTEVLRDEWGFRGSVVTDYSNGGTYMNVDQGIRAGNDLWLNGSRSPVLSAGMKDKTSATAVSCSREAAKNILYTYCNTRYLQSIYEPSEDEERFKTELGSRAAGMATPYWLIGLIAIDIAVLAGLGVWVYFLYIRKPKVKVCAAESLRDAADEGE